MFAYIARQPIFDVNREVFAYELLFRDGEKNCFPDIPPDEATSKLLASSHLSLGLEEIVGDKLAFINFHRDTLMYRFPTSLDASQVVIEVLETIKVDNQLVKACKHLRGLGFLLALDDYDSTEKWRPFLPFTSIIKFDITTMSAEEIAKLVPELKERRIKLVAEKIETYSEFEKFKAMGFDYFQGYFLAYPELVRHRTLESSKVTLLELLTASAAIKMDFDRVNAILERDVSLTYLLLRFINNPMFNKRNKITSLKHALTYMGEVEVKKFIALIALANLSEGQPSELLQMSLVRAKFCELVSVALKQNDNPPIGFLTGLLSLLDALMEQPMEGLMKKIPVSEEVKDALCGRQNLLKDCLLLVTHFESANWAGIKKLAAKHELKQSLLHSFYNESIKWGRSMQACAHQ
ncbi:EAL and HDOD domain-containing protein [Alteromonas sp. ASW11-130]|uniref:EAL and HDOD domain-containing protein n=1 Tax=Alteromonas sp. ASW11-130 TaxID=3015775 RepID=UPI002241E7BE|nr:HDOD domain-containing protein [Alteromonas sp. ASW11-130]MCW8091937.1 HDOD domain-containing protein [Alteromonas sp. ASW11-130]